MRSWPRWVCPQQGFFWVVSAKHRQRFKLAVQQNRAVCAHPLLRHRGVHAAEVDGGVDVAFRVQSGEVGRLAVEEVCSRTSVLLALHMPAWCAALTRQK